MLNTKKSAIWRFFLLCLLCNPTLASAENCPASLFDESAIVKYVHDGDTVKLVDGRKIRLIGINAPEVAREDKPAEAFAISSRDLLRSLLSRHNNHIRLIHGEENQDHYKRGLSHLFLPDGTNLQAQLLSSGLASAITIPPNQRFSECYQKIEKQAFCSKKGVWSNKIASVSGLDNKASGFQVLRGKLKKLSTSHKDIWLSLERGLSLRIASQHKPLFDMERLQSLVGKSVIVKGWLQIKKNPRQDERFYMQIKHPSSINEEKTALEC